MASSASASSRSHGNAAAGGGGSATAMMLPGPPGRGNGGCIDLSAAGLLAHGAGSSVVVSDPRSMQLLCVLPMPSSTLASFVTSVRWAPPSPPSLAAAAAGGDGDDDDRRPLRLAAGDRHGRIAVWDARARHVLHWLNLDETRGVAPGSGGGVQDLCWIHHASGWLLASVHGPSLLCIWETSNNPRVLWMFDASPEYLCCLRRDPFDSRHLVAVGLRGFLLSAIPRPDSDISLQEHRVTCGASDIAELQRLEKEIAAPPPSPALAAFPGFAAKLCFSPLWRHILYVTFPRELIVYDLNYSTALSVTPLPRGFGKFSDVMADPDLDLLCCTHLDGKLSIWKRKEGEQVHLLCAVEELMPSIGTIVPPPAVLATTIWQSESIFRNIDKQSQDFRQIQSTHSVISDTNTHKNMYQGIMTYLTSISEDGKIWSWHLKFDKSACSNKVKLGTSNHSDAGNSNPRSNGLDFTVKINLMGQLHLLSSTVTTLAVPSPSLLATVARGGNNPAPAVPLVALGTQNGTVEVVDVLANAVSVSFAVHGSTVRGLRWLGNSRLVSFSYTQVNDKTGGYNNKLIITCLRSGLNRSFRVLQKPERAPIRALRASSSGRYLLILFRDAPVEVWAMTKNPMMLRSLALPFTVLEWTLPSAPRPASKQSATSKERSAEATGAESTDETSESFAFALVNGALGVFEVHGRRIRDFRPKWPSSSFASADGLVTAMAYRLPHVVMGDRSGNIRWWDVTTGLSSSFSTHREGIRRIKFSPVVHGDRSRGRIAVLFYDNTFSIFDLDSADPLANALLQPQSPGTLVLELDWLSTRTKKDEPLVLCIAGADSSFRLIEVNIDAKANSTLRPVITREKFRSMPLCLPILFPTAHALALRMILQLGVKPSWFECNSGDKLTSSSFKAASATFGDLRSYMIETTLPPVGDSVVAELLLKVLEPYRKEGCILDDGRAKLYSAIVNKGTCARFAFAAAVFGDFEEALFWLQLPQALRHYLDKSTSKSTEKGTGSSVHPNSEQASTLNRASSSTERSISGNMTEAAENCGQLGSMAFTQEQLWFNANERIPWHDKLDGEEALQKRVHELVSLGNLEAAVSLLLSTPPEGSNFYPNALRAVVLSSAVSRSLHELAVKVVAANMVRTDKSLCGTHLLCAVGRYQEACSQLQDAGCWVDAATLAASHLHGSDYARVLQRWADYVLRGEHNMWRALILYVAAGALPEALETLRKNQRPDTAAMFLLACHEIYSQIATESEPLEDTSGSTTLEQSPKLRFPSKNVDDEDLIAVSEVFGQYQQKLIHVCMDAEPNVD
uniref:Uncharacterized protein n=1 Tax=Leersia perrieri TaxID=77586 RepID=A0A0D9VBZ7_9ORYZ